jgi:hypothetical protein
MLVSLTLSLILCVGKKQLNDCRTNAKTSFQAYFIKDELLFWVCGARNPELMLSLCRSTLQIQRMLIKKIAWALKRNIVRASGVRLFVNPAKTMSSVFTQLLNPVTGEVGWEPQSEAYDFHQEVAR